MTQTRMMVGIVVGVVAVVAAGFIVHAVLSGRHQRSGRESRSGVASQSAVTKPAQSAAKHPTKKDQNQSFTLPALLVADNTVDLYAKASGYVVRLNVDIGSRVRAGDVLLKLAIPEMEDELRRAEAQLNAKQAAVEALKAKATQAQLSVQAARADRTRFEAERNLSRITYDRQTELYRGKAIPAQQLDEVKSRLDVSEARLGMAGAAVASAEGAERAAQADVKAAEAEVTLAGAEVQRLRTLIGYETIAAPFDGVITRRNVDLGWFVRSAAEGTGPWLLTLDKVDRIRVVIDIPEAEVPWVRTGTPVEIDIMSLKAPPLRATITRTAVAVRTDTRTMRAEVDLANADGRLSPGMYAKVIVYGGHPAGNRPKGGEP